MENELVTQVLTAAAIILGGIAGFIVILTVIFAIRFIGRRKQEKRREEEVLREFTALIYKQETGEEIPGFIFTGSAKNAPPDAVYLGEGQYFVKY